jgi:hypothetical protein
MGERVELDEPIEVDKNGYVTVEDHKMIIDPAVWVFIGFMIFAFIIFISTVIRNIIYHKNKKHNL